MQAGIILMWNVRYFDYPKRNNKFSARKICEFLASCSLFNSDMTLVCVQMVYFANSRIVKCRNNLNSES